MYVLDRSTSHKKYIVVQALYTGTLISQEYGKLTSYMYIRLSGWKYGRIRISRINTDESVLVGGTAGFV